MTTDSYRSKLPAVDAEYWDGPDAGELRLQQCGNCGYTRFPPAATCPRCLSGDYTWHVSTGHGVLWSWIRVHRKYFAAFEDRLFDPDGLRPPIWFQEVPEAKAGKNRLHLDLYPTGRDNALPMERRIEIVETKVAELNRLGASVQRRDRHDDPEDPIYYVVMHDPEGNEFCVS